MTFKRTTIDYHAQGLERALMEELGKLSFLCSQKGDPQDRLLRASNSIAHSLEKLTAAIVQVDGAQRALEGTVARDEGPPIVPGAGVRVCGERAPLAESFAACNLDDGHPNDHEARDVRGNLLCQWEATSPPERGATFARPASFDVEVSS